MIWGSGGGGVEGTERRSLVTASALGGGRGWRTIGHSGFTGHVTRAGRRRKLRMSVALYTFFGAQCHTHDIPAGRLAGARAGAGGDGYGGGGRGRRVGDDVGERWGLGAGRDIRRVRRWRGRDGRDATEACVGSMRQKQ